MLEYAISPSPMCSVVFCNEFYLDTGGQECWTRIAAIELGLSRTVEKSILFPCCCCCCCLIMSCKLQQAVELLFVFPTRQKNVGFFLEVVLGRTTSNLSLSFVLSYLSPCPLTAAWLIVCVFSAVEKVWLLCVLPATLTWSKSSVFAVCVSSNFSLLQVAAQPSVGYVWDGWW